MENYVWLIDIPDWPWIVGCLFLLLIGFFFGVTLAGVGEMARQRSDKTRWTSYGGSEPPTKLVIKPEEPSPSPKPKVDWGAINLDLAALPSGEEANHPPPVRPEPVPPPLKPKVDWRTINRNLVAPPAAGDGVKYSSPVEG